MLVHGEWKKNQNLSVWEMMKGVLGATFTFALMGLIIFLSFGYID
jgi:hypothetical protein